MILENFETLLKINKKNLPHLAFEFLFCIFSMETRSTETREQKINQDLIRTISSPVFSLHGRLTGQLSADADTCPVLF